MCDSRIIQKPTAVKIAVYIYIIYFVWLTHAVDGVVKQYT